MQFIYKFWDYVKSPGPMAVIAIIGFLFAIYATWFYEKKPSISVEIVSNTNVFDIHENLGKLDVIYSGKSLRASKQILRLINFRILNSGQTNFRKNDFDETDALGFAISEGKMLEKPTFIGSSSYIQERIKPKIIGTNEIRLESFIFDSAEYIEVHVLIAINEGTEPTIRPLGKIAGVKEIQVITQEKESKGLTFISKVWGSNPFWVHIVRSIFYAIFFLIMLMVFSLSLFMIVAPFVAYDSYKDKADREKNISKFETGRVLSDADRFVINIYRINGDTPVTLLNDSLQLIVARKEMYSSMDGKFPDALLKTFIDYLFPSRIPFIDELEKLGLIKCENSERLIYSVDESLLESLLNFANFIGLEFDSLQVVMEKRMKYYKLKGVPTIAVNANGEWFAPNMVSQNK